MNLALFDLDNTLLNGDSDFEWAQFLIGKGVLDREVHEDTTPERVAQDMLQQLADVQKRAKMKLV